jgi:hypothetical protein
MSDRTITELLVEMEPELDEVQRGVLLHHLEHAATHLTMVAWNCARVTGVSHATMRELVEKVDDLRRAFVKLGGQVDPFARGAFPPDIIFEDEDP